MQAVILAAGRGTRMDELTTSVPKAMLELAGKPLLEYKFDAMPEAVDEIVLVVGYLARVVRARYRGAYLGRKLVYVEQRDLNGTAGALWCAKDLLRGRFLVLNGDDIFTPEDLQACAEGSSSWKLLVQEMPRMHRAGAVQLDESANVAGVAEGDFGTRPGLASTNSFALDARLFSQPMIPKQEGSLEYGLPQTVIAAAKELGIRLEPVFTADWIQINAPADLVEAERILKKRSRSKG